LRIFSRSTLTAFWKAHADAEEPLRAWFAEVEKAQWQGPKDIKRAYASASFVGDNRVVFNIKGNTYRLIVHVKYEFHNVFIRFVGTHAEYDKIDGDTI
jgi:mRNA interferase HigB